MGEVLPAQWLAELPRQEGFVRLVQDLRLIEGFGVLIALCASPEVTDVMWVTLREEVERARAETGVWVRFDPYLFAREASLPAADWLVSRVFEPLTDFPPTSPTAFRVVVVDATRGPPEDDGAWSVLFQRLNRARNVIALRQRCPVLFVMPPRLEPRFVASAPDIWSVRTAVATIESPRPSLSPEALRFLAEANDLLPRDMLELVPDARSTVHLLGNVPRVPLRVGGIKLSEVLDASVHTDDPGVLTRAVDALTHTFNRPALVELACALDAFARATRPLSPLLRLAATEQAARVWTLAVEGDRPPDAVLHDLSMALHRVGDLRQERGDFDLAFDAYEQALVLRRRLYGRHPDDPFWQSRLLRSLRRKGDLLWRTGDVEGAGGVFDELLRLSRAFAASRPRVGEALHDLTTDLVRSTVAALGRRNLKLAASLGTEAEETAERLVALDGQRPEWQQVLALARIVRGVLEDTTGQRERADALWTSAELALRSLERDDPHNHAVIAAHRLCLKRLYGDGRGAEVAERFALPEDHVAHEELR